MLEFIDAWKQRKGGRRDRWVLAGATLAIPPRRRVALFAPELDSRGSLLRMMSGADSPDRGAVRRNGLACWTLGALTFMDNNGTLRQNANFLGHVYGVDPGDMVSIASELSGVKVRKAKVIRGYSIQERRQLALGLTLSLQFEWYFIDEVLPPVTPETTAAIDGAIADRLSRAGVVWATRNPTLVESYCDAGLVLDRGALTFYDDFAEAADVYRLLIEKRTVRKRT